MKIAFVCNNFYHLMNSFTIAKELNGNKDLYLIGDSSDIERNYFARDDIWENKYSCFMKTDAIIIWDKKRNYIENNIKILKQNQYDYIIYFVDKNILNQIFLQNHKNSCKILVEEGIGLYNNEVIGFMKSLMKKIFYYYKFNHFFSLRWVEQGANNYNDYLLCRFPALLSSMKKNSKICKYNKTILPKLFKNLNERDFFADFDFEGVNFENNNNILFIGSNFSGKGREWFGLEHEKKIIKQIFKLLDEMGFNILVKMHPNEFKNKYSDLEVKFNILEYKGPVEILSYKINPKYIISFMSSSLINLIGVSNLIYLYNFNNNDFPNKKNLIKVNRYYNNVFKAPSGIEEFENNILESSQQNLSIKNNFKDKEYKDVVDLINEIIK